jgi:hypothetical protein
VAAADIGLDDPLVLVHRIRAAEGSRTINATELLKAHLDLMTADFPAWKNLYAEDAVMEFVYGSSAGVDTPVHGIEAITKSVEDFWTRSATSTPG